MPGSVYLRRDGRYEAAVQINGKRFRFYGHTEAEARARLESFLRKASPPTLRDFAARWLRFRQPELRPTTLDHYERLLRNHILPELGDLPLGELTPFLIQDLYLRKRQSGLSPKTIRLMHAVLRKLLNDAVEWGQVAENPVRRVRPPRVPPKLRRVWSAEQARRFMEAARKDRYGPLFLFLLGTGCRLGEALALRWEDLDLERGAARLQASLTEVRGEIIEGPPKTPHALRTVHLPAFVVEALRGMARRGDYVFWTAGGKPPGRTDLMERFRKICLQAGVPPMRIHDLRHLHASLLIASGVDLKTVQSRLGHATPAFTLQVYAHVVGDGDRMAARAMEILMNGREP